MRFSSISPLLCLCAKPFGSFVEGLALDDYAGSVVVGEVAGEETSCNAVANASTDEISCEFEWRDASNNVKTSVDGATLYADIVEGTCADATIANGDLFKKTEATSNPSTNGATTATLPGTVTAAEKTGLVQKTFCARADLKDDTHGVSVLAAMTQVQVDYTYDQTGNFQIDNIATSSFEPETATAQDTRQARINAFQSNADGVAYEGAALEIGETFHIAVESLDSDVAVDITELKLLKKDGSVFNPEVTPITGLVSNFVTTKDCTSKTSSTGANKCVVSTLLVPSLLDQQAAGDNGIKVTGTAFITYQRRFLKEETRALQADTETEEFELEVDLKANDDLPQIASSENSGSIVDASSVAFAAIAAGYAIVG